MSWASGNSDEEPVRHRNANRTFTRARTVFADEFSLAKCEPCRTSNKLWESLCLPESCCVTPPADGEHERTDDQQLPWSTECAADAGKTLSPYAGTRFMFMVTGLASRVSPRNIQEAHIPHLVRCHTPRITVSVCPMALRRHPVGVCDKTGAIVPTARSKATDVVGAES